MTTQQQRRRDFEAELAAIRPSVLARNGGRCERCDDRRAVVVHHKAGRKVPGANRPELLAALCAYPETTTGCHEHIHAHPADSYRDGWLIHEWDVITPV